MCQYSIVASQLVWEFQLYEVKIGMRYSAPFIDDVMKEFAKEGISKVVLLPNFPQAASSPPMFAFFSLHLSRTESSYRNQNLRRRGLRAIIGRCRERVGMVAQLRWKFLDGLR